MGGAGPRQYVPCSREEERARCPRAAARGSCAGTSSRGSRAGTCPWLHLASRRCRDRNRRVRPRPDPGPPRVGARVRPVFLVLRTPSSGTRTATSCTGAPGRSRCCTSGTRRSTTRSTSRSDMYIRDWRELKLVLLPAYGVVGARRRRPRPSRSRCGSRGAAEPGGALGRDVVLLRPHVRVAPPRVPPARGGLVGRLRADARGCGGTTSGTTRRSSCSAWNFNVTLPLWDSCAGPCGTPRARTASARA